MATLTAVVSGVSKFDLVADAPCRFDDRQWRRIQYLLLEFQPARRVRLDRGPPTRIRIEGFGGAEVASGILAEVEDAAGVTFHVEVHQAGGLVCPRCSQDYVGWYRVIPTEEALRVCPECDATWTAGKPLDARNFHDLSTYLAGQGVTGQTWSLIEPQRNNKSEG